MRLNPIGLLVTLALSICLTSRLSDAQQATKVHRIGWLSPISPPAGPIPNREAFQQGLRDLGYVEGQNLAIEYRYAEGHPERLPALAAELVRLHVDVILAPDTPAALAAKQATSTIPIIMAGIGADPVAAGLVASLARPGGNVTGVTVDAGESWGKGLELLEEAATSGIDLYLCGHTHGGQICLPWLGPVLVNARCRRRYVGGQWTYKNVQGYTSYGTGSSCVPVRFNCPPEIGVIELKIHHRDTEDTEKKENR